MSETIQKKAAEAETLVAEVVEHSLPEPVEAIAPLSEADQKASAAIKTRMGELDMGDSNSIINFGSAAQAELQTISQAMLTDVRNKDVGPAGDSLRDIVTTLRGFSVDELDVRRERTFWEKVLILHAMTEMTEKRAADSDPGRPVPDLNRYSRHYYDVHQIWRHAEYGENVASMRDLAEACRQHKQLMFRAPDHRYDRAIPGTYRLVPTIEMLSNLRRDYNRMSDMIFGTAPAFDDMMASISELETFLNRRMTSGDEEKA